MTNARWKARALWIEREAAGLRTYDWDDWQALLWAAESWERHREARAGFGASVLPNRGRYT